MTRADFPGTAIYTYDADGARVAASVDGSVTNFLVDVNRALPQVIEERDGAGALVVRYVYGSDLISQTRGAATSFYHYDGSGSTPLLSNAAGSITDTDVFDAFGVQLALLNRVSPRRNWNYRATPACAGNIAALSGLWCDEYPFATTQQGSYLSAFYGLCKITPNVRPDDYVTVAVGGDAVHAPIDLVTREDRSAPMPAYDNLTSLVEAVTACFDAGVYTVVDGAVHEDRVRASAIIRRAIVDRPRRRRGRTAAGRVARRS